MVCLWNAVKNDKVVSEKGKLTATGMQQRTQGSVARVPAPPSLSRLIRIENRILSIKVKKGED